MRALVPDSVLVFTELAQCRTASTREILVMMAIADRGGCLIASAHVAVGLLRSQKIVVGQP
jgi:hypothetical protein